jgi:hypothetical protein
MVALSILQQWNDRPLTSKQHNKYQDLTRPDICTKQNNPPFNPHIIKIYNSKGIISTEVQYSKLPFFTKPLKTLKMQWHQMQDQLKLPAKFPFPIMNELISSICFEIHHQVEFISSPLSNFCTYHSYHLQKVVLK